MFKNDEIVVWGNRYSGGAPFILTDSGTHPTAKTNYSGLTVNDVYPNNNGYAIFQNGEVNFIGNSMKINGGSHATSAITNVLDVQTSYIPSPNNNFAISIYENPFVLTLKWDFYLLPTPQIFTIDLVIFVA